MIYTTEAGQTIIDVAIEYYGCYEGVFLILEDNPTLVLGDKLNASQKIVLRDAVPTLTDNNVTIAQYFATKNIKVNSGDKPLTTTGNNYVEPGYVETGYVN